MRVSGTAAVNFTCMDYYKRVALAPWLQGSAERRRAFIGSFLAGGLAGATSTTLLYPLEFVRTRLAMDGGSSSGQRKYKGMWDAWRTIGRTDGILGFYQGYGIAVTGGIFYRLLYLGGYDAFKGELLHYKQSTSITDSPSRLSWGELIVSAQLVTLVAGTLSYPFDSVRRRMMMQAGLPREERLYRSSLHCIGSILRSEGLRGFFLGLAPNILRSIGGALLLVGYDAFRLLL